MSSKTDRLYDIFNESRTLSDVERDPETKIADLGIDSLDLVEIVMNIEEEFGVVFEDDDVEKYETLDDFISYIEKNGND